MTDLHLFRDITRIMLSGLFMGPEVLAVTYRLIEEWVTGGEGETAPDSSGQT